MISTLMMKPEPLLWTKMNLFKTFKEDALVRGRLQNERSIEMKSLAQYLRLVQVQFQEV